MIDKNSIYLKVKNLGKYNIGYETCGTILKLLFNKIYSNNNTEMWTSDNLSDYTLGVNFCLISSISIKQKKEFLDKYILILEKLKRVQAFQ